MIEPVTTFKIELGIAAHNILSQTMLANRSVTETIQRGIERAFADVGTDVQFENLIYEATKKEILAVTRQAASDWNMRHKVTEAVRKAVEEKIDKFALEWAEQIVSKLDPSSEKKRSKINPYDLGAVGKELEKTKRRS